MSQTGEYDTSSYRPFDVCLLEIVRPRKERWNYSNCANAGSTDRSVVSGHLRSICVPRSMEAYALTSTATGAVYASVNSATGNVDWSHNASFWLIMTLGTPATIVMGSLRPATLVKPKLSDSQVSYGRLTQLQDCQTHENRNVVVECVSAFTTCCLTLDLGLLVS